MGGLFSAPKMPDNSAAMAKQEEINRQQQERLDQQAADKSKELMARRRAIGRGGMNMLLSPERPDAAQGLSTTLGPSGTTAT